MTAPTIALLVSRTLYSFSRRPPRQVHTAAGKGEKALVRALGVVVRAMRSTRFDKTPASYMAGLQLRGSIIWIRSLNPGRGSGVRLASRTPRPLRSGRRGDRSAKVPGEEIGRAHV